MADAMMGGAADPMAQAAPEEGASQDYCIEIKVQGGAISVSVEPLDEENQEEAGAQGTQGDVAPAPEADDSGTQVRSAKEAGQIVVDIINNGGQMSDPSQPSMEQVSAEDAFKVARGGK